MSEMLDRNGDEDDEDSEGASDSDEELRSDEDSMDEDADDNEALDKLDDFVSGLETSKKRKAGDRNEDDSGKKKKRVILKERTEAYPEGEFVAVGTDAAADSEFGVFSRAFNRAHLFSDALSQIAFNSRICSHLLPTRRTRVLPTFARR